MNFVSLSEVQGVTEIQPLRRELTGVSINSRTLNEGNLFVAIKGDKFDGHNFLDSAVSNGASG
ncbi:MAG: UDP-N-acetylmuramoyl-tripeptide--D-alanyl-D-alanine ligase, partial [Candidatus Marinimicrobia bacterium]|nr:UDP-N-acetylmuramoyl-tripeptide--D-alanyl-D-alanine ligase [Candidatus Neomarinimicrobiota bacterium]